MSSRRHRPMVKRSRDSSQDDASSSGDDLLSVRSSSRNQSTGIGGALALFQQLRENPDSLLADGAAVSASAVGRDDNDTGDFDDKDDVEEEQEGEQEGEQEDRAVESTHHAEGEYPAPLDEDDEEEVDEQPPEALVQSIQQDFDLRYVRTVHKLLETSSSSALLTQRTVADHNSSSQSKGAGTGSGVEEDAEKLREELYGADVLRIRERQKEELKKQRAKKRKIQNQIMQQKKSSLPVHLGPLMGAANTAFVLGDLKEAAEHCLEVIRQAPQAAEPYNTLGTIYEQQGRKDKAAQLYFIAAHLRPAEPGVWLRMCAFFGGDPKQQIYCYTKALAQDKQMSEAQTVEVLYKRAQCYKEVQQLKQAWADLRAVYRRCVQFRKAEDPSAVPPETWWRPMMEHSLEEMVRHMYHEGQSNAAIHELEKYVSPFLSLTPEEKQNAQVNYTLVNFYCELLYYQKKYGSLVNVVMGLPAQPIELQVRLAQALIQLQRLDEASNLLNEQLRNVSIEEYGDLFLEVAEALYDQKEFQKAVEWFERVDPEHCPFPVDWIHYGKALRNVGQVDKAIDCFQRLLHESPDSREALLALHETLLENGRSDEALQLLLDRTVDAESALSTVEQSMNNEEALQEVRVLAETAYSVLQLGRSDEFVAISLPLFDRVLQLTEPEQEVFTEDAVWNVMIPVAVVNNKKKSNNANTEEAGAGEFSEGKDHVEQERPTFWTWGLLEEAVGRERALDLLLGLCRFLPYDRASFFLWRCVVLGIFGTNSVEIDAVRLLNAQLSFLNGKYARSILCLKVLCMRHSWSVSLWNFLSLSFAKLASSEPLKRSFHARFAQRLSRSTVHPLVSLYSRAFVGTHSLTVHYHRFAAQTFFLLWKDHPKEPIVILSLIGALLNLIGNRRMANWNVLAVCCVALLHEYSKVRGFKTEAEDEYSAAGASSSSLFVTAEIKFNLARIYHTIGMSHLAASLYEELCTGSPADCGPYIRLAAFHWQMLATACGNRVLAQQVTERFLAV